MDRIEPIGPRSPQWQTPPLDPDREDIAKRQREQGRRREEERRRRQALAEQRGIDEDDDGPHVDVRV